MGATIHHAQANTVSNIGPQRTAVILIKFNNMTAPATDPSTYEEAIFTAPNSIDAYIQEMSYGKAWLIGDVFGWYEVDYDFTNCGIGSTWTGRNFTVEAMAALDPYVYWPDYQRIIVITTSFPDPPCGIGATSWIWPEEFDTEDGLIQATWVFVPNEGMLTINQPIAAKAIAHELTHNMGVWHENSYDCGDQTLDLDYVNCNYQDYGSPFSNLGFFWKSYHVSGYHKDAIGWLDPEEVALVEEDGIYRVYPLEWSNSVEKTIKIPLVNPITVRYATSLTATLHTLYLDYRQPLGFDQTLDSLTHFTDGLLLYGALDIPNQPALLLDATPESQPAEFGANSDFHDAFLAIGETFYELGNCLSITPLQLAFDGGLDVEVRLAPQITQLLDMQTYVKVYWSYCTTPHHYVLEWSPNPDFSTISGWHYDIDGSRTWININYRLSDATMFYFRIAPCDELGQCGTWSLPQAITLQTPLITKILDKGSYIKVYWKTVWSDVDRFQLQWSQYPDFSEISGEYVSASGPFTGNPNPHGGMRYWVNINYGITVGETYYFRIRAWWLTSDGVTLKGFWSPPVSVEYR
jgi:M6 family metalloprotease-like protein